MGEVATRTTTPPISLGQAEGGIRAGRTWVERGGREPDQNRMMPPATVTEQRRRRDLRRMKAIATGFLVVAVAAYAVTRRWELAGAPSWVGYARAAAEAGTVGALADWFAVTALFRRPLGLPIPHTAIIPTRKDALGRSLEEFVATNFLAEDVIRDKVGRVGVAARVGGWLSERSHAERVTAELGSVVRGVVAVLRDEDVQEVLEHTVVRRIVDRPWAPAAGRLLAAVVADGTHHRLVDLAVDEAHTWLLDNRATVVRVVTEQAPAWSPRFVDDRVAGKLYTELVRFARDVKTDPGHGLRLAADAFLTRFANDLRHDPATIYRAEQAKDRVLRHPEVAQAVAAMWTTTKRLILDAVEDPSSELRVRVTKEVASFGDRLVADVDLRGRVDGWLEDATAHLVTTYRGELATVITDTVNRWDAAETSRKVEVQVGRDLQFIRINGTVVGALAGLVIHTVSAALL